MSSLVRIDSMTASDVDAAVAIDLTTVPDTELLHGGTEGAKAVRERQLHEELDRPWARVRVARKDGAVVGFSLVWHVVDEVHLLNIVVAPEARRAGVGRALMDDLLSYAVGHAVVKVFLEVRVSNAPAIALYESLGFARTSIRAKYYSDGEDAIDMHLMIPARA